MRFSVVINTVNREKSLAVTLEALRRQTHPEFEVVVVNGPSKDGTADFLARLGDDIRVATCPDIHLSKSRNIGIDTAAGEVVAFLDDDAIPEPTWLAELDAAYADGVSGAGGLVLDTGGVRYQYRFSMCTRLAETRFVPEPPGEEAVRPGADPFLYLQGTNASFLRRALVDVDGFDEEIAYMHDETELAATLADAGHHLVAVDGAVVHHKYLPSHVRRKAGYTDPYHSLKNRAYLALRWSDGKVSREEIVASLEEYCAEVVEWAEASHRRGGLTAPEYARFVVRAEEGVALGIERGTEGVRRGRAIAPADADAFVPFPTLRPAGRGRIVFTSVDYPPKPLGGIARFTVDLAEGIASRGHDVHVITRDDEQPPTVEFENGVWVHRTPAPHRLLPELDGSPLVPGLEQAAMMHAGVDRLHRAEPVDVVCGPLWGGEPLLCAVDPRFRTVTTCMTPLRVVAEMQEKLTDLPSTAAMVCLEDETLRRSDHLVPISEANGRTILEVDGASERPTTVVHLGVVDRRDEYETCRESSDDGVEILFVGRLEARKGVDVLLRAAIPVLAADRRARLRLVGADNADWSAGENWSDMASRIAGGDPDVLSRIDFAGAVDEDELMQAFADADVFCAPSLYESFGLVVAEAMMMSLPVVSTDAGGVPEVAVDGETAFLVPPGEHGPLREALEKLVADADLRARFAAAGRARYEKELDNEVVVDRVIEVLLPGEPVDGRPRPRVAERFEPDPDAVVAVASLLEDIVSLRGPEGRAAAATLVDPARFAVDLPRELLDVNGADTRTQVAEAFAVVRGRPAEADELGRAEAELGPAAALREAAAWVIREAGNETALPASAADPLPDRTPAEVVAALRRAWMGPAETVLPRAVEILAGAPDADLVELAEKAAASGGLRDALDALVRHPRVLRRCGLLPGIGEAPLHTEDEVAEELRAIGGATTEDAIDAVHVLLVGEPPDAAARASARPRLTTGTRLEYVRTVATTDSADGYGTDADVVVRLAEAEATLRRAPSLSRVRSRGPVQRGEMLARSVLGDIREAARAPHEVVAEIESLHARIEEIERASRDHAEAIAAATRGHAQEAVDELGERLAASGAKEIGALRRDLADLRSRLLGTDAEGTADLPDEVADLRRSVEQSTEHLGNVTAAVTNLGEWMTVLSSKYEAIALDFRERLPAQVHEDMPEPEVLDPAALEPGGKANLGCGEKILEGYVNVDFRALPGVAVVADVRRLPFAERSLSEIASHHLVEHFRERHLEQVVLPHWRELLADDGILRIVTPNLDVLVAWYRDGKLDSHQFKTVLFGLQDYHGDDHFALYDPGRLEEVVRRVGFTDVEVLETDRPNGWSPEIELIARPDRTTGGGG